MCEVCEVLFVAFDRSRDSWVATSSSHSKSRAYKVPAVDLEVCEIFKVTYSTFHRSLDSEVATPSTSSRSQGKWNTSCRPRGIDLEVNKVPAENLDRAVWGIKGTIFTFYRSRDSDVAFSSTSQETISSYTLSAAGTGLVLSVHCTARSTIWNAGLTLGPEVSIDGNMKHGWMFTSM